MLGHDATGSLQEGFDNLRGPARPLHLPKQGIHTRKVSDKCLPHVNHPLTDINQGIEPSTFTLEKPREGNR